MSINTEKVIQNYRGDLSLISRTFLTGSNIKVDGDIVTILVDEGLYALLSIPRVEKEVALAIKGYLENQDITIFFSRE